MAKNMWLEIVITILVVIESLRFIIEAGRFAKDYNYIEEPMTEEAKRMFT
jgi:hypothetical protein